MSPVHANQATPLPITTERGPRTDPRTAQLPVPETHSGQQWEMIDFVRVPILLIVAAVLLGMMITGLQPVVFIGLAMLLPALLPLALLLAAFMYLHEQARV